MANPNNLITWRTILLIVSSLTLLKVIETQDSCRGRCASEYERNNRCHCDSECIQYGECCEDYRTLCTSETSCSGRCFEQHERGRKCQCDRTCMNYGDCCSDFVANCEKDTWKNPAFVATTRANLEFTSSTRKPTTEKPEFSDTLLQQDAAIFLDDSTKIKEESMKLKNGSARVSEGSTIINPNGFEPGNHDSKISDQEMTTSSSADTPRDSETLDNGMTTPSVSKDGTLNSKILVKVMTTSVIPEDGTMDSKTLEDRMTTHYVPEDRFTTPKTLNERIKTTTAPETVTTNSKILYKEITTVIPKDASSDSMSLHKAMTTPSMEVTAIESTISNARTTMRSASVPDKLDRGTITFPIPEDKSSNSTTLDEEIVTVPESNTLNSKIPNNGIKAPLVSENVSKHSEAQDNKMITPSLSADYSTNSKNMHKGVTTSPIPQDVPKDVKILDKGLTTNTDPEKVTAGHRVLESVKTTSALPEAASTNARISDKGMASLSVPVGGTTASKMLHKIITSSPFLQASTSDSKILDNVVMTSSVPKDRTVNVKGLDEGLSTHFADKGSFTVSKILDRRMTTASVLEHGDKYSKTLASKVTTYSASEGEFMNYNILDTAMPKNTFPEENSMSSNILDNRMSTSRVPVDASTNARMSYDGMTSFPAKIGEAIYSEVPHHMFITSPFPKDGITYSKILDQKLSTQFYGDTSLNFKKVDTEMTTSSENGIIASEVSYKGMATSPNPGEVTTDSEMLHKGMPWAKVPEYERSSSITVPQDGIVNFKNVDTGITLHTVPEISSADPGKPSKGMITSPLPKVVISESITLDKGIPTTVPARDSRDSKLLNNEMTMLSITEDSSMIYKTLDNKMKTPSIPTDASILDKEGTTTSIPQDNSTEYKILDKGMKTDTIPKETSIDPSIPKSGTTTLSVPLFNTGFLENGTTMLPAPTDQTISSKPQLKIMTPSPFPEDGSTKSNILAEGLTTPPIPKDVVTDTGKITPLFPVGGITDSKVLAKKLGARNISADISTVSKLLDNAMTVPSLPEDGTNDSTILDDVLITSTSLEGGTRDSMNLNKSTSTYHAPEDRFTYSKIINKGIKITTPPGVASTDSKILNKGITPSHVPKDDIPASVSLDKVITIASTTEADLRETRPLNTQIAYTVLKETTTPPSILDKGTTMFPALENMANDYEIMEKTTTIISQNNSMDLKILKNGTNKQSATDNLSIFLNKITTPSLPADSKIVNNGTTASSVLPVTTVDSKMLMKILAISAVTDDRMTDSKITNIMVSTSDVPENGTNDSKTVLTTLSIPENGTRVTKVLSEGLTTPLANEGSSTESKLLETELTKTSVLQDGKMHSKILDNIMKTSNAFESGFEDPKILPEGMKTTIVPENYSMNSEITSSGAKTSLITRGVSISSNVASTNTISADGTTDSVFLDKGLPTVSNTDVGPTEPKTSNTGIATYINPGKASSVPSIFNKDMTTSTVSEERTNNSKILGNKTAANISENVSMDSNVHNHRLTTPSVAEDIYTSSKILYDKMGNSSVPVGVTTEFNILDEIMTTAFIPQVTSGEANLLEAEMTTQTILEQASSKLVIGITPSVTVLASTNSNTLDNRTITSSVPESKMTNLKAFLQIITQSSFPKTTNMQNSTATPPIVTDASTKAEALANARIALSVPDGETMLSETLDKGITTTASFISAGKITHSKILNEITSTDTIPEKNTTDYSFLDKRMTAAFTTEVASIEPTHSDRQVTTPTAPEEASPVPMTLDKRMTASPAPEQQTNDSKFPDKVATTLAPADSSVDTKLWKNGHTVPSSTEDISTGFKILDNKMTDSSLPVDVTTDSTILGKTTTMAFFREDAKTESKISETRLTTHNIFDKVSGRSITLISGMTDPSISTKSSTDSQILDNRIITSSVPEGEATDAKISHPIMTPYPKDANTTSTFSTKRTTTPTDPEGGFLNPKILDKEITTSLPNNGTMNKGISKIPFTEDITGYNTLSKILSNTINARNTANDSKILDSVLTTPVLDNGTMDSRILDRKLITAVLENDSEVVTKTIAVSPVLQDTIMSSKIPYKTVSAATVPENGTMDSLSMGNEITKAFTTEGAFIQLKALDRENATQILPEEILLNPSKLEKGIESLSSPEDSTSNSKIQYKLATAEDDSIGSEITIVPLVTEGVSMSAQISDNKMSISSVPADGNTDLKTLDTTVATVFINKDISTEPKILVHAMTDSSVTEDDTMDSKILNKGITTIPNDDSIDQKILDEGVTTLPVSLGSITDSKIRSEITSSNSEVLAASTVDGDVSTDSEGLDNEKTIPSVPGDATMDSKTTHERITTIVLQENSTHTKILNNQATVPSVHKDAPADSMASDKGEVSTTTPVHEFTDPKIMPAGIANFAIPEESRIDPMSGMLQNGTTDSQILDERKVASSTKIYSSMSYETLAKEMSTTAGTSTNSRFLNNGTATHPESEYRSTASKILGKGMTASSINKHSSTDSKASDERTTAHSIPIAFSKTKFLDKGTVKYSVTAYRTTESEVVNKGGGTVPEDGPKISKLLQNERITSPTSEKSTLQLNSFHTANQIQPTIPQETSPTGSNLNKGGILQSSVPSHPVASDPILKTVEKAQVNVLQNPVTVESVNLNIEVKIRKEELIATNSELKRENIKPNVPVKYEVPNPTGSDNTVTELTHEERSQITGKTLSYEDMLNDSNLCNKKPSDAMTTLQNGTTYIFRGHLFWTISQKGQILGHPHRISDVWGIPSPIDTVFTRCNCLGNTYFFKGDQYWRFQNGHMDTGYPRRIAAGFSGLSGEITAALSVAAYSNRPETVYFFKKGGLYQKYVYQRPITSCPQERTHSPIYQVARRYRRQTMVAMQKSRKPRNIAQLSVELSVRKNWQGFPLTVTSAISLPNPGLPEKYEYYVLSRAKSYKVDPVNQKATYMKRSITKDVYKCL